MFGKDSTFDDSLFNGWVDGLDDIQKTSMTAGKALSEYKSYLESAAKSTSTFSNIAKTAGSALKTLGAFTLNMVATMAIEKVFELGAKAIYNWINASEIAIQKGKEAKETIASIYDEYQNKSNIVNNSGQRFDELRMGVNQATNENISLTNDQYSEYLSLCNEIAGIYPELVTSYDAQGNAILNLGSSAQSATEQLSEMLEVDQQIANLKIADNLQTAFDGAKEEVNQLQEQIDSLSQSAQEYQDIVDTLDSSSKDSIYSQLDELAKGTRASLDLDIADQNIFEKLKKSLHDAGLYVSQLNSSIYDSNGDGENDRLVINFDSLPDEKDIASAVQSVKDAFNTAAYDYSQNASQNRAENLFEISSLKKEQEALWSELLPQFESTLRTNPNYTQMTEDVQTGIMDALSKVDLSALPSDVNIEDYIKQTFLYPISGVFNDDAAKEVQDSINKLFSLDTSTLNVDEYENQVDTLLSSVKDYYIKALGQTAGESKFNDFVINFGFKVKTSIADENGEPINGTDGYYNHLRDLMLDKAENYNQVDKINEMTVDELVRLNLQFEEDPSITIDDAINNVLSQNNTKVVSQPIFPTLFKDSEGNATDFSKQIDTFKSNISSLNEARNTLLSGGTVDMSELFSNFPDLAQQSGNLVDSLNKLKNQNIADSLSSAYKEMSTSKNPQDIASMKNYLVGLITDSASELSDSDMQQVQSMLVNSIVPASSGKLAREEATQWVKSLFEDAIDNISPMKELSNRMDKLKSSAQEIQNRVSLNDSLGIKNTKSDYRALIDNSKEQVRNLQQQNEELQKSLVGLNENSDAYKSITSQIQDNVSSINDARQAQQEWNDTVAQLDYQPLEGLTAYNKAKSTRNAGDNYLDMLSAAKEAQKAREKGLVGTDDFKTVAKMFSPNGMDDYQNWDENYSKIQRYFTEGDTGAKNFLNDLSQITRETENGTIALAEFDDSTKTWSYNIDDVQASADALGISFEAFLAIMGRLQDYGFSNDFFSSIEDGQDHLGGLYSELAQAETELIRLQEERDNGNATVTDTVLRSQEAKIESIKSSILSTQDLIDQLMNRQVSDYEAETQSALRTAQSMIEKMGESDNEVTKRRIQNDLESFAEEYGITLQYDANTGELLGLSQSNQEILQEAMDKDPIEIKYKTPDLTNRPKVSPEKMWEAEWNEVQPDEYATVYSSAYSNKDETKTVVVTPILPDGNVLDEESLRGYADQLLNGEEIDAQVHLATFEGEDSVQQANNYSDALHAVQEAYYSEDEGLQSLISSLGEYNKAQLESIQLADDSYDETYAEAEKSIDNILSTLGLSTDQASALYTVLEQMGLIKPSVEYEADTSNVDEATSEIESSNPTVNVDTEADTENLESEIKNGDYTVEATVTTKTDGSSTEPENREATVDYKKGEQDKPEKQTTLVNYDRGVQEPPEPKMTKVNYTLGTQALPQEKTVKVHYDTSEAPKASGTLLTAHASGTAYNVLNLRAHASGTDVSIKRDEVALVNELGNEALIRNGKLYEIPGGTHMQSLKRGDVIINAAQWAEIKKYGSTNTFAGTAYATGTFGQIPIAHAYASNIGPGFVGSSSSSSSSTAKTATKTAKSVEKVIKLLIITYK